MALVFLNGELVPREQAQISVMDRGFLFGDGVYEVIPVYAGKLFRLAQHLDRLEYSLSQTGIETGHDRRAWQAIFERVMGAQEVADLSLYLQVTRGAAEYRDHPFPQPRVSPNIFVMATPLPSLVALEDINPVSVITVEDIRWQRCDIKSIALLGNVMMRQLAVEAGVDEAIVINAGEAIEGTASNLFVVKDGRVTTPAREYRILGGITRDLVIELLQAQQIPITEGPIERAALEQADEIWLSSSTKEIRPVTMLDGNPVGSGKPGSVWCQAASSYLQYKARLYG